MQIAPPFAASFLIRASSRLRGWSNAHRGEVLSRRTPVADKSGRIIGEITSGGFGPSLNAPVAMGYVETAFAGDGTEVDLIVRGKPMPARIAPMPFFPRRYRRTRRPQPT